MADLVLSPALEYLSQKRTHLSHPGTLYTDLYPSPLTSTVQSLEANWSCGKFLQNLPSLSFGSSNSILIPNGSIMGSTYLYLRLPNLGANVTVGRGWGYSALQNLRFQLGSSNVAFIEISKANILSLVIGGCNSSEKSSEIVNLGGEEWLTPLPDGYYLEAIVQLPYFWSTLTGGKTVYGFDTNLLNNPITLQITFANANQLFGGSGTPPTGFSVARLFTRQCDLANPSLGLRNTLLSGPDDARVTYPYIYQQSFTSPVFAGSIDSSPPVLVNLTSFINSDLLGMFIYAIRVDDEVSTGSNSPNPLNFDPIRNILVQLNGQTVYNAIGNSWKCVNMNGTIGASYFLGSVIQAGVVAPFTSFPVNTYPLYIEFAKDRVIPFGNDLPNTSKLAQQTMTLTFNTSTTDNYHLYGSFLYPAVAEISKLLSSDIYYN